MSSNLQISGESSPQPPSTGKEQQSMADQEHQPEAEKSYLVEWDGDNDPLDPRTRSKGGKWFTVAVVALGSLLVTCTSSIYTPAYEQLMAEFGCSEEVVTLGLALYVLGLAIGPLLFSPLSEFYGRRPIYIISTSSFLIWLIPCAAAQNIQTLLVARFLTGLSGSAFLAVAAGTVVDIFAPQQLLIPMTVFTGAPFVGPALGPLLGGFICTYTTWRWVFYLKFIWTGLVLAGVLCVPETFHPVLLARKAAALRKGTGDEGYHSASEVARRGKTLSSALLTSLYVPFKLLLLDPMIAVLSIYSSILQGILYLFFGAFPLVFGRNHKFNLWQIGLAFLPLAIGNVMACFCNPLWHKDWMARIAQGKNLHGPNYKPKPELRLPPAMVGSVLVTASLFWFAWTTFPSVHWIVPMIAMVVFAVGFSFAFQGIWTFLVAAYPKYAASAMAVNTTTRCTFAAAFPLFTTQMYEYLGYQWASSLLAFLLLAMVPFPFLFFKYGSTLRAKSKFASS